MILFTILLTLFSITAPAQDFSHPVCDAIKRSLLYETCPEIEEALIEEPIQNRDLYYCYFQPEFSLYTSSDFTDKEMIAKPIIYALELKAHRAVTCLTKNSLNRTHTSFNTSSFIRDFSNGETFNYQWMPAVGHLLKYWMFKPNDSDAFNTYPAKAVIQAGSNPYNLELRLSAYMRDEVYTAVNQRGFYETSMLHLLAGQFGMFECHPQAIKLLLAYGANPNAFYRPEFSWYFLTPLDVFMRKARGELENCKESLKILLSHGANPNLSKQDRVIAGCASGCEEGGSKLFEILKERSDVSQEFKREIATILAPKHTQSKECLTMTPERRQEICPWLTTLL